MNTCQEEDDRLVIAFNSLCKCFGAFHYCQHLTFLEEESDNILTATTPRIRITFSENSLSGCVNEFFYYPTNKSLFFNFHVFFLILIFIEFTERTWLPERDLLKHVSRYILYTNIFRIDF